MGRKPRAEYEGGLYHVIQRGNNREFIFNHEDDKTFLLRLLKDLKEVMGYKIFGFSLLDNHYHLVLQTLKEPLQSIMHRINSRYSKFFNQKYGRSGHVYESRYKAIHVGDEKYLLSLLRYVHQNPVRAGICQRAEEYRWSSDYFYRTNNREWVDIGLIMDMLSDNQSSAIHKYIEFMTDAETENFEDVRVIGQHPVDQTCKKSNLNNAGCKSLDEILWETGISDKEFNLIKNGSRKRNLTVSKLMYVKKALDFHYTLKAIGENIKISDVAVLDMLKRHNLVS